MYQPPNQPQYPPQPNTYYPPQQPMIPPPPPPRKKRSLWLIVGIIVGVSILCGIISTAITRSAPSAPTVVTQATDTPTDTPLPTYGITPVPTDTPAPPPKWTATHTFSGSGIKKTGTFSVPDDWKLTWNCNAGSFYGSQYNVQVYVYNSDASLADVAINELCKSGNTSGETEEHQAGDVYLSINSEASWVISILEVK